jgi:hypothetical protein
LIEAFELCRADREFETVSATNETVEAGEVELF